ncbi:MAG: beta strand repeat-containing protein, partial [Pyrinomonadaceae bacterium]
GTTRAIQVFPGAAGGNFTVSGNMIGGSQTNAGGAAWTNSGTTADSRFVGIQINASSQTSSSVQGNVIRNVVWETSGTAAVLPGIFCGIFVQQGAANIGTTAGNTIGSEVGTDSISVTTSGDGGTAFGIGTAGFPDRNIFNNIVGSITTNGTNTGVAASLVGIQVTNGINTITGNTIGSNTTANSLNANNSSTSGTGQRVFGIHSTNLSGATISNNTITNVNNNAAGEAASEQAIGILTTQGTNLIIENTVSLLTNRSGNVGVENEASVIGISQTSTSSSQRIEQNTTFYLVNLNTNAATKTIGIFFPAGETGPNSIARNLVFDLAVSNESGSITGIRASGRVDLSNNMLRLGTIPVEMLPAFSKEHAFEGGGIAGAVLAAAFGVDLSPSNPTGAANPNFRYHEILILGSGASKEDRLTAYAVIFGNVIESEPVEMQNNILVNQREITGNDSSQSILKVEGAAPNSNNNLYSKGDAVSFAEIDGEVIDTLSAWQNATDQDGASAVVDPMFVDPDAVTPDLHLQQINPAVGAGVHVPEITTDFDGDPRPIPPNRPTIGADENPNFTPSEDAFPPNINLMPLTNGSQTTVRVVDKFVKVIDNTAVAGGSNGPRVYISKDGGVNFASMPLTENAEDADCFDAAINHGLVGGVNIGDTISYYVVAQDIAGKLTSNPPGVLGTDVNNISQHPTNPLRYDIVNGIGGTLTVGQNGARANFTGNGGIFQLLNQSALTGNLQVIVTGNMTEPGTHSLTQVAQDNPGQFTVTVRPANPTVKTIMGNVPGEGMLRFDRVENLIFDGSVNGQGNFLRIGNINTSSPTIKIEGRSGDDTFRNLIIEGANQDPRSGVVHIDRREGMDDINFIDNIIRDNASGVPRNLLYGSGNGDDILLRGTIEDNAFVNFNGTAIFLRDAESMSVKGNLICSDGTVSIPGNLAENNFDVDCSGPPRATNIIGGDIDGNGIVDGNDFRVKSSGNFLIGVRVGNSSGIGTIDFARNTVVATVDPDSTGTAIGVDSPGGGKITVVNSQITALGSTNSPQIIAINNQRILGGQFRVFYTNLLTDCISSTNTTSLITGGPRTVGYVQGSGTDEDDDDDDIDGEVKNSAIVIGCGEGEANFVFFVSSGSDEALDSDTDLFVSRIPDDADTFERGGKRFTFAEWQQAFGQDLNSLAINENVEFVLVHYEAPANGDFSVIPSSGFDAPPPFSNNGSPIPEFPLDIIGNLRNPGRPDIGAYEFEVDRVLTSDGTIPAGNYDDFLIGLLGGLAEGTGVNVTLGGIINVAGTMSIDCASTLLGVSPTNYVIGNIKKDFCSVGAFSYPVGTTTGLS